MNKQALSLAVFIAGAYPAASNALGLGDIESNSHLNQPLRARIELLAASPADANQLQVRLASPDVFNRVGVARPAFLNSLQFTPTVQGGKPVILITSSAPIQEPFVNFLLEVSWPQGQLLKEYTVMLDPPVLMQPGNTVGAEASVRAEPKSAGTVRRPSRRQRAAAPTTAQPQAQAGQQQAAAPSNASRSYRVKTGDTLFKVASRVRQSGVSNEQMMMALFRSNPKAFIDNNINNLKVNAVLTAPKASEADNITRAEARRQIRQQNAEWRGFRQALAKNTVPQNAVPKSADKPNKGSSKAADDNTQPRLEVLGSKDAKALDKNNAAAAADMAKLSELEKELSLAREALATRQTENDELKSRVTELESMISKKSRLISLRNDQLAGLQKQMTENGLQVPPLNLSEDPDAAATPNPAQTNPAQAPATQNATPPVDPAKVGQDLQTHLGNVTNPDNTVLRADQTPTPDATPVPPNNATPPAPDVAQQLGGVTPPPDVPPPTFTTPAPPSTPTVNTVTPPVEVTPPVDEKANPFAETANPQEELLNLLTSPLAMMLAGGALLLLLLLWLFSRLRKPKADKNKNRKVVLDDTELTAAFPDTANTAFDASTLDKELNRDNTPDAYTDFDDASNVWGNTAAQPATAAASNTADAAEEDDLLTEANVYIAYGLYQQAESELKKGIERQPERLEYRHKLLECYFVSNNREAFDRQAEQFAALDDANKTKLWPAIAEWGRKISPDNKLYQESTGITPTAIAAGAAVAATVASSLAAADSTVEKAKTAVTDAFDFDLDNDFADLNNVDLPDLDTMVAKPTAALETASTTTADVTKDAFGNLDGLDFDNLDLDKLLQEDVEPVVAQPVASLASLEKTAPVSDDVFDLLLDEPVDLNLPATPVVAEKIAEVTKASTIEIEDDNLLDFSMDSLSGDVLAKPTEVKAAATPVKAPLELDSFDLDLDEPVVEKAVAAAKPAAHVANLNLHLDSNNVNKILPKDTFYAPANAGEEDWLGDIDDALSFLDFPDEEIDLHEAHISTKLDLACAYLDMGDIEGARSTLEEVMVEGNDDQRREAEVLLHQTG